MKKNYILILLLAVVLKINAQQSMTLYNMQAIPQRSSLNPALQYAGTATFGIPLLSSVYINYSNSAFKVTDFIRRDGDDSLYLDGNHIISKMKDEHNTISTSLATELFTFGFRIKKSYIGLSATEKINVQFDYPKEMMEFLWKGNAATLGKETVFQFGLNAMHYREYAFNYSVILKNKLSLGTKIKYLYGMENASSNNSRVSLYTDPNSFAITAKSTININTSGLEDNTFGNFNMSEYAFGRKNTGFAIDFGTSYRITEKLLLSASILDIGKIKWNSHVVNYKSNTENGEFTYSGIDLNQFVSGSTNNVWQDLSDTLTTTFRINPSHDAYETRLPSQFYVGSNYIINKNNSFGILMHGENFNNKLHNDYTISFNKNILDYIYLSASYSVINQTYSNFGFGMAYNMGRQQIYIVSDNIYGTIYPTRSQNANFRAGINFIFTKKHKVVKQAPKENETSAKASEKTQE